MRIAIISRHPAPYRDPLLSLLCRDSRFQVQIFNEMELDAGHDFWDLKKHGYPAQPLFPSEKCLFSRLLSLLQRFVFGRYDFVLWAGFNTFELTIAMFASAVLGRKYGFMADTVEQKHTLWIKRWAKRTIARKAALIFVPGSKGADFWVGNYGINPSFIAKGLYALDGDVLSREIDMLRGTRHVARSKLGIGEQECVYLMVANMLPTRHYPITVAGFLSFAKNVNNSRFVIIGRGPELHKMQKVSEEHPELIIVPGCSFEEMKSFYAMADVYVHGGKEPASTALIIGAIAGLPLISSAAVGCAADVLVDGKSGICVPDYHSASDWENAFIRMQAQGDLRTFGKCARELSRQLDVSSVYDDFVGRLLNED